MAVEGLESLGAIHQGLWQACPAGRSCFWPWSYSGKAKSRTVKSCHVAHSALGLATRSRFPYEQHSVQRAT